MMSHYPGDDLSLEDERFYKILEREVKKHVGDAMSQLTSTEKDNKLVILNPNKDAVHMKLKVKGSAEKILFFHWLMAELDADWPYSPKRRNLQLPVFCEDCKGYIYRNPEYSPDEIKLIAKQIDEHLRLRGSLNVKVKMFATTPSCADVATIVAAKDALEAAKDEIAEVN